MMNERIQKLLIEAHKQTNGGIYNGHLSEWTEKFAELIIQECENYILSEVERLVKYQNSLSEDELNQKDDVEICIEKCYDNILGIRQHFGVE